MEPFLIDACTCIYMYNSERMCVAVMGDYDSLLLLISVDKEMIRKSMKIRYLEQWSQAKEKS